MDNCPIGKVVFQITCDECHVGAAPPPPPLAAPPLAARPSEEITFDITRSLENAANILEDHAKAVRQYLREIDIAGDGYCLFRSISAQTPQGEGTHLQLRQKSCEFVEEHPNEFTEFFIGATQAVLSQKLKAWVKRMKGGAWGDGIALRACSKYLMRPMIVWRKHNLAQPPLAVVPESWREKAVCKPMYLLLDETVPGSEHYTALAFSKDPPITEWARLFPPMGVRIAPRESSSGKSSGKSSVPEGADDGDNVFDKGSGEAREGDKKQQAKKRGCQINVDGLGPWGKYGLVPDQLQQVITDLKKKSVAEVQRSLRDVSGKEDAIPQQTLSRWKDDKCKKVQKSLNEHMNVVSMVQEGCTQQAIVEACGVGTNFISAVTQRCSSAAQAWLTEHQKSFSVVKPIEHAVELPATKTDDKDVSEAHAWMQTPSWTFCPECGRRRLQPDVNWGWALRREQAVERKCEHGCDHQPETLMKEHPQEEKPEKTKKLMAYMVPDEHHWHAFRDHVCEGTATWDVLHELLPEADMKALAIIDIKIDYETKRGGSASVTSKKKKSIVRAVWRPRDVEEALPSLPCRRAFEWLRDNNSTYQSYLRDHRELLAKNRDNKNQGWRYFPTCELLLQSPGIEVAARPWLYPLAAFADSDIAVRLKGLNSIPQNACPSLRVSWMRKILSRCVDYVSDYPLQALLHDIAMARTISAVVNIADQKKMAPDEMASEMSQFEVYWHRETQKLEDICRQEGRLPNVFFTLAPGEWAWVLHTAMLKAAADSKSLSDYQSVLTLHIYNTIQGLLEKRLLKNGDALGKCGLTRVSNWVMRFEFQDRGTIHVHVLLWTNLDEGEDAKQLSGKTDENPHDSKFVKYLEDTFRCRVDVQCGDGHHTLLRYVAGYVAKASDALQFKSDESKRRGTPTIESKWRAIYRMLCKRAPLEQEMAMEFASLSMVKASFTGVHLYAPIPGSKADNADRRAYNCYQQALGDKHESTKGVSYLEWWRRYQINTTSETPFGLRFTWKERNKAGPGRGKPCAVGLQFPFELLDIYMGAWAAAFLSEMKEQRLVLQAPEKWPENTHHLKAVLNLQTSEDADAAPMFPDADALLGRITPDLRIRGLGDNRVQTFCARIRAGILLLGAVERGETRAEDWSMRRIYDQQPKRIWSSEQAVVLKAIKEGSSIDDANDMAVADRTLHITGEPGAGKSEVTMAATVEAAERGCRVLIVGPIGLLVSMYRLRLPPSANITMETIHSAFRITRERDKQYIPPGRLRHYDLIIFDEVSQIDKSVWEILKVALAELSPCPFVVFVGDFQQLQPVCGVHQLQLDLNAQYERGTLRRINLAQHAAARSSDPDQLAFLNHARLRQPSRRTLLDYFSGRCMPKNLGRATRMAYDCIHFVAVMDGQTDGRTNERIGERRRTDDNGGTDVRSNGR